MNNFSRRWVLSRLTESEKQTLGRLYVFEGLKDLLDVCVLELPWKNNTRKISRINSGRYRVKKRQTEKFGNHFHIQGVYGRDGILTHKGNFYTQIEGCLLVGTDFRDINGDGEPDVVNSGLALKRLYEIMPDEFYLDIVDPSPGE
jgi:hypothetical protein